MVTIIFDVDQGLIFGFVATFLSIVAKTVINHSSILANALSHKVYVEKSIYTEVYES